MKTSFNLATKPEPSERGVIVDPVTIKALAKDAAPKKDHRRVLMGVHLFAGIRRDDEGNAVEVTRCIATDGKVLAIVEETPLPADDFGPVPDGLTPCLECTLSVDALPMLAALVPKTSYLPVTFFVRLFWTPEQTEKPEHEREAVTALAHDGRTVVLPLAAGRFPECEAVLPRAHHTDSVLVSALCGKNLERVGRLVSAFSCDRNNTGVFYAPKRATTPHLFTTENHADRQNALVLVMPIKLADTMTADERKAAERDRVKARLLAAVDGLADFAEGDVIKAIRAEVEKHLGAGLDFTPEVVEA